MLSKALSDTHAKEIAARGLDLSLVQRLGVYSTGDAIAFDYIRNGKIHNTKLRRGKGNMPWAQTGLPLILWNADCLQGDPMERELIITEGEFDAIACIQVGHLDVVSVPNGAPASENEEGKARFQYLFSGEKLLPEVDKFRTFILAVDNDEKGLFLRDALAVRLGEHRCCWVEWPAGCKDANDVLRDHGPEKLREVLASPKRMWTDEVATLDDIPDPPKETSYNIGFDGLDSHLRLPRKGFVTVLGPYESGKSTFLRQLMMNMSMKYGWKSAITCFEESAKWRTVNALKKTYIGKPVSEMSAKESQMGDDWLRQNIVFLMKKKRVLMDAQRLLQRIEYAIKVYGLNMVIIDPFNEIDHSWDKSQKSKSDYIGDVIMELKDIADSYSCLMICCVHPPTMTMRNEKHRKDKCYTLSDSADSAHFANKSDIGLCFWRPPADGYTLMNIDKIKNRELCGTPTGVEFRFHPSQDRYTVARTGWNVLRGEEDE